MPIYDYKCSSCGHTEELMLKVENKVLRDCPKCGEKAFDSVLTTPNFQFKGNGYYVTDFKHK